MYQAKIIIGVRYDKAKDMEHTLACITADTEVYSHIDSDNDRLSVWVDDVKYEGKKKE